MNSTFLSIRKNLAQAFIIWAFVTFLPLTIWAQGAWTPANADATFPRTLIKTSELSDLYNYLQESEPYGLFQTLWGDVNSYNPPAALDNNGKRRRAAFVAKNAAFFHLIDRKPDNGSLVALSTAESEQMRDLSVTTMERMITNVEVYPQFNEYLWRSNELINNVIAYDLLKGAGVHDTTLATSKALLIEYAGNLYEQASFDLFGLGFLSLHVDNHALRTCGALGVAAVVLSDENDGNSNRQPRNWFNLALFNIDNVFWKSGGRQSEPGMIGGYSEGPHYLRFGSKHVLPFFHAMGNFIPDDTTMTITYNGGTRNIRHPWHDPNYDLLFEWVLRIGMPDGRNPALEDAFIATAWEELAIWEKPELSPKVDYSRWAHVQPGTLWQMLHHSSDDVVADYLASMTPDQPDTFPHLQTLEESGNLVFRSGWDSLANYLHFTAKNGRARSAAQGHNQGDASSFILHANGELLAIDPGYLKWDRRDEVGEADNHNLILVDGQGPATGTTASANGADAFIQNPIGLPGLKYAEVATNYSGADIVRRSLMVRGNHFFISDDINSNASHDYTFQLHGYGLENGDSLTGYFTDLSGTGQAKYEKGDAGLFVTMTADNGIDTYGKTDQPHEWKYDSLQYHTTFLGSVTARQNADLLCSLIPYSSTQPTANRICNPACEGIEVDHQGFLDIATVGNLVPANSTGLQADLTSNADFTYYSQDANGDFAQFLVENATQLSYGALDLFSTSNALDFAMQALDTASYQCYSSDGGTVYLGGLNFEPLSVNGLNVQNWVFNIPTQTLEIQLGSGGYFTIHEGVVISRDEAQPLTSLEVYPNPGNGVYRVKTEEAEGEIRILDLTGRLHKTIKVDQAEQVIDLETLASGIWIFQWHRPSGSYTTQKVVKR